MVVESVPRVASNFWRCIIRVKKRTMVRVIHLLRSSNDVRGPEWVHCQTNLVNSSKIFGIPGQELIHPFLTEKLEHVCQALTRHKSILMKKIDPWVSRDLHSLSPTRFFCTVIWTKSVLPHNTTPSQNLPNMIKIEPHFRPGCALRYLVPFGDQAQITKRVWNSHSPDLSRKSGSVGLHPASGSGVAWCQTRLWSVVRSPPRVWFFCWRQRISAQGASSAWLHWTELSSWNVNHNVHVFTPTVSGNFQMQQLKKSSQLHFSDDQLSLHSTKILGNWISFCHKIVLFCKSCSRNCMSVRSSRCVDSFDNSLQTTLKHQDCICNFSLSSWRHTHPWTSHGWLTRSRNSSMWVHSPILHWCPGQKSDSQGYNVPFEMW